MTVLRIRFSKCRTCLDFGDARPEDCREAPFLKTLMKTYRSRSVVLIVPVMLVLLLPAAHGGWQDLLNPKAQGTSTTSTALASLTQNEMIGGLKEALSKGVQKAVADLGRDDGFLKNVNVKIPVPESLKRVEQGARMAGQDKLADEFIATMNHAAEKAVPEAAAIFGDAITKMSLEDAQAILKGPDDAATQYFRKTSETQLTEKMMPIVKQATEKTGVTASYKKLMQQAGPLAQFMKQDSLDLDHYVTGKALDGLFKMVAAEEKSIRQNPVARSTDLLKKVFGTKLQ